MNRSQRRKLAKSMGLFKNLSDKQKKEIRERSAQVGPQIHRQFIQNVEANIRAQEVEKDNSIIESYIATGMTRVDAEALLNKRKEQEQLRELELIERRERQKEAYEASLASKKK
jgi:hypothetical protein